MGRTITGQSPAAPNTAESYRSPAASHTKPTQTKQETNSATTEGQSAKDALTPSRVRSAMAATAALNTGRGQFASDVFSPCSTGRFGSDSPTATMVLLC